MNSFKELHLNKNDKAEIVTELTKLCFLRGEELTDYDFEVWMDYWAEMGYNVTQVKEMIELAKKLPKYGSTKLAIGDLISVWEKNHENEKGISYKAFLQCLNRYMETDLDLLNKLSNEFYGLDWLKMDNKQTAYGYIIWQIEEIKKEKDSVRYANDKLQAEGVINIFEKIKQDRILFDKAYKYISSEKIKTLKEVKDYYEKDCAEIINIPVKDKEPEKLKMYNHLKFILWLSREIFNMEKN